jgi:hypothetical protein
MEDAAGAPLQRYHFYCTRRTLRARGAFGSPRSARRGTCNPRLCGEHPTSRTHCMQVVFPHLPVRRSGNAGRPTLIVYARRCL